MLPNPHKYRVRQKSKKTTFFVDKINNLAMIPFRALGTTKNGINGIEEEDSKFPPPAPRVLSVRRDFRGQRLRKFLFAFFFLGELLPCSIPW